MGKIKILEKCFVVISLILISDAIFPLLRPIQSASEIDISNGDVLSQVIFSFLYLITIFLVFKHKLYSTLYSINRPLFLLIVFTLLSVIWSVNVDVTLRRIIGLFGTSLFGYYLGLRFDFYSGLKLIYIALCTIAIFSIITVLLLPKFGLMGGEQDSGRYLGAWKGIYYHKNNLGEVMVLLVTICYVFLKLKIYKKLRPTSFLILAVVIIYFSQSTSALLISFTIIGFSALIKSIKKNIFLKILSFASFFLVLSIMINYYDSTSKDFFSLFGKDATLTGRTALWGIVFVAIMGKPILGYGYGAFFAGQHSEAARLIWSNIDWEAPHSHNGLLDLGVQLGILGIVIYLYFFFSRYFYYINQYTSKTNNKYLFGVLFFTLLVVYNFIESNILEQKSLYWVVLIFTVTGYSKNNILSKYTPNT